MPHHPVWDIDNVVYPVIFADHEADRRDDVLVFVFFIENTPFARTLVRVGPFDNDVPEIGWRFFFHRLIYPFCCQFP